jgi:hypothetical protein
MRPLLRIALIVLLLTHLPGAANAAETSNAPDPVVVAAQTLQALVDLVAGAGAGYSAKYIHTLEDKTQKEVEALRAEQAPLFKSLGDLNQMLTPENFKKRFQKYSLKSRTALFNGYQSKRVELENEIEAINREIEMRNGRIKLGRLGYAMNAIIILAAVHQIFDDRMSIKNLAVWEASDLKQKLHAATESSVSQPVELGASTASAANR